MYPCSDFKKDARLHSFKLQSRSGFYCLLCDELRETRCFHPACYSCWVDQSSLNLRRDKWVHVSELQIFFTPFVHIYHCTLCKTAPCNFYLMFYSSHQSAVELGEVPSDHAYANISFYQFYRTGWHESFVLKFFFTHLAILKFRYAISVNFDLRRLPLVTYLNEVY